MSMNDDSMGGRTWSLIIEASRVPIATTLQRTRMASKSDRNSLMECIHFLYPNRTAAPMPGFHHPSP